MPEVAEAGRQMRQDALACTAAIRGDMKTWFADLRARVADGAPFVLAPARSPHEILEAFDIAYVSNEWWSGQVAARRQSGRAFDLLESLGYHAGLPRYSALSLATALDTTNPSPPMGGLPKPAFILYPGGKEAPRAEAVAEAFGCPAYSGGIVPDPARVQPHWWDTSRWMWEDAYDTARIDCIVGSYREIIAACERVTGRRFDIDRLREIMARVAEQEACFEAAREAQRNAPRLPVSLAEEMGDVMTIQWRRGTEWALAAAQTFRDELLARAQAGLAVCETEQMRLGWSGVGLWQNVGYYRAFERSHGAVFVRSMYTSVAADCYPRYGLRDPLRALAARYAGIVTEIAMPPASHSWELHDLRAYHADGVVMLPNRDHLLLTQMALEDAGVPTLVLPVDAVDGRSWDDSALMALTAEWLETRVAPAAARRLA